MNPAATLTGYSILVALLALAIGLLVQIVNSGKVLGQWQVPASWLPWLTIVLPFLSGVAASLKASGDLTPATVVAAIFEGLTDVLSGSAPGLVVHAAMHAHIVVPQKMALLRKAPPANDNASPPTANTKKDAA